MLKALNRKAIALAATLQSMYLKAASEERGDTNFISILIILGIVILVAGVFIGFKDQIVGQVQAIVGGFTIR
ncbi:MAG: hypothetical protein HFF83_10775 [Oscillibacter sp.]|jgi:hypothetical protein|nr:hypothetical protein [Oscillibacter sp.]